MPALLGGFFSNASYKRNDADISGRLGVSVPEYLMYKINSPWLLRVRAFFHQVSSKEI